MCKTNNQVLDRFIFIILKTIVNSENPLFHFYDKIGLDNSRCISQKHFAFLLILLNNPL